ncbi:MAG: ABC-2 family transporter protein [Verrucomicrobiia bacterium]
MSWSRYLKIWLAQIRYSLVREMMFKANFLLWLGTETMWFSLQLIFVEVVYGHVGEVAGWSRYEMILLVGVNHWIQQLFQAFFMVNFFNLPELIRTGKLDFYLAQPVSPQFLVSTRLFEPGALINGALGLGVCGYAILHLGLSITPLGVGLFILLTGFGVMIHYSLLLALVTLSFWIVRSQGLIYGYYNLFQISRLPRQAFKGMVRIIFTFALPMLLVANVPSEALLGRVNWNLLGVMGGLGTLFFLATHFLFNRGLRAYGSASS